MLEDEDDHQEVAELVVYLVVEGREAKLLAQMVLMMMLVLKVLLSKMVWAMELQVGQCHW